MSKEDSDETGSKKSVVAIVVVLLVLLFGLWFIFGRSKTYTVTFDSNGGTTVEARKVKEGKSVEKPDSPKRDNYIFAGWYEKGESEVYDFGAKVTKDLTLIAQWIKESTSGEGDSDGGEKTDGGDVGSTGGSIGNVLANVREKVKEAEKKTVLHNIDDVTLTDSGLVMWYDDKYKAGTEYCVVVVKDGHQIERKCVKSSEYDISGLIARHGIGVYEVRVSLKKGESKGGFSNELEIVKLASFVMKDSNGVVGVTDANGDIVSSVFYQYSGKNVVLLSVAGVLGEFMLVDMSRGSMITPCADGSLAAEQLCGVAAYYFYSNPNADDGWDKLAYAGTYAAFKDVLADTDNNPDIQLAQDITGGTGVEEIVRNVIISGCKREAGGCVGKYSLDFGLLVKNVKNVAIDSLIFNINKDNVENFTDENGDVAAIKVDDDELESVAIIENEIVLDDDLDSVGISGDIAGIKVTGDTTGSVGIARNVVKQDPGLTLVDADGINVDADSLDELVVLSNTLDVSADDIVIKNAPEDLKDVKIEDNSNGHAGSVLNVNIDLDLAFTDGDFVTFKNAGEVDLGTEIALSSQYPEIFSKVVNIKGSADTAVITVSGGIKNQAGYTYKLVVTYAGDAFVSAKLTVI